MMFDTLQGLSIPEGVVAQIAKDGVLLWSGGESYPVTFNLTNITNITGEPEAKKGVDYTCVLEADSGKWLPQTIEVKSGGQYCQFEYDYLLKMLTIPGRYIIGDITITAKASDYNTETTVVLGVEKVVSTTYSGTTKYENEEFVVLDVYPKSGGTVNVTYGGVTKTIVDDGTSEEPNSQQVYFGTLYGVSDDVETPSSGILAIEGDYAGFATSDVSTNKMYSSKTSCINEVISIGSVTSIGDFAFNGCSALTNITIPDSVTSIGYYAFTGCTALTNITIPNSVTSIGASAFFGCTALTNITIPKSVTTIGANAFFGCSALTNVTIPKRVTTISELAFYNCTALTNITIQDGVTSIGVNAFGGCTALTNITIPKSVTTIGANPFSGCTALTEFIIQGDKFVSENGALFNADKTRLISYPTVTGGYAIPNGIKDISYAFRSCTALTNITIPDSVTSIGKYAFFGCTALTNVTIPKRVTTISEFAFNNCTALTNITIPDSVTSIGDNAFGGCTALTNITIPDSVTSIGASAFSGCTALANVIFDPSLAGLDVGSNAFNISDNSITLSRTVKILSSNYLVDLGDTSSITPTTFGTPSDTYTLTIIVPSERYNDYTGNSGFDDWKNYYSYIVEAS